MRARQFFSVAALLAAVLAPACAPAPDSPAAVRVSLIRQRDDLGRQLQIRVGNEGTAPVTVRRADLISTRIAGVAEWEGYAEIPPGAARDLPVRMPAAQCADGDTRASVTLLIVTEAEDTVVRTTPTDPIGSLADYVTQDCLDQMVRRIARMSVTEPVGVHTRGDTLIGIVELRITADTTSEGALTVDRIRGTTLLRPPDGRAWQLGLTVGSDAPEQQALLEFTPNRCDPHAVAEDKRGTLLPVEVEVGGQTGTVYVPLPRAAQAAVYAYLGRACEWG